MFSYVRAFAFTTILVCINLQGSLAQEVQVAEIPLKTTIEVRSLVYSSKLTTRTDHEVDLPARVLVVPEELEIAFRKHPLGVLSLLSSIVEGARPRDAHIAYCYAVSLAVRPEAAAHMAGIVAENEYDSILVGERTTMRTLHANQVRRFCSDLEGEEKVPEEEN